MSRQRRSRNAKESTSETREDRAGARSTSKPAETESRPTTPSASEETSAVTSEDTGRSAGEDKKEVVITKEDMRDPKEVLKEMKARIAKEVVETSTKATAVLKLPVRKNAMCPKCHERRYKPEQADTKVKCMNCRTSVVLI